MVPAPMCKCLAPGVRSARALLEQLGTVGRVEQRRALARALAAGDVDAAREAMARAVAIATPSRV